MLIEYKNVNVYQDDREVLRGVDFHVDEGEFIYIIGKVGTGKSSFLKTIYCELDIDEEDADTAEVLGRNLKTLRRREVPALRKELGVIFQDFQLLHDRSVWENLQFVLKSTGWKDKAERAERIEKVLADVGMSDKKHNMPYELSGGEQQRIAIARAILNNPKVIIADEPTGNLDLDTATNIVALLRDITQSGTAVVMSTHNLSMLSKYPGIVYRCGDGKIKEVTDEYSKIDLTEEDDI
ncbi:MAG: ATP-binding cassette domain-containing protein [Prevotella sp.]|jgi:cell-division ATP-binding protein|nr:MAG: ATP-binding cassette domain-containing protein [Prevotella sp.]